MNIKSGRGDNQISINNITKISKLRSEFAGEYCY